MINIEKSNNSHFENGIGKICLDRNLIITFINKTGRNFLNIKKKLSEAIS